MCFLFKVGGQAPFWSGPADFEVPVGCQGSCGQEVAVVPAGARERRLGCTWTRSGSHGSTRDLAGRNIDTEEYRRPP